MEKRAGINGQASQVYVNSSLNHKKIIRICSLCIPQLPNLPMPKNYTADKIKIVYR